MKNIIKIVFAIIAAFIGAGFASGQEINVFFYSYGAKGIIGLLLCSFLMSFVIYKVLKIVKKYDVSTYKDFLFLIVKNKNDNKYMNLGFIINFIVNLFLLITFFIMVAGFGAYFCQELGLNSYIGSAILACLCFITFIANGDKIININSIIIPILILFIIIIGIINFFTFDFTIIINNFFQIKKNGWLLSSILYSSYNSIFLVPIIITFKKYIKNKNEPMIIAIFSGVIILILSFVIFSLLTRINININLIDMPIIYVISNYFEFFKFIYSFIILASIYTTAISVGIGFLENIKKYKKNKNIIILFMCIIGILISGFGFSNLITYVYPIFGVLGLIQIILLFLKL